MDRQELRRLIDDLNPHWTTGAIDLPSYIIEREALQSLRDRQGVRAIVGLRRTGKTTLLRQLLAEVTRDLGAQRTCYFSFDLAGMDVRDVVEVYCEDILRESPAELNDPVHFFLDEVQNRDAWSQQVKHFVDNYRGLSFTVTGSSAVNILKGGGESLAGRLTSLRLYPFSFREYLRYNDIERERLDFSTLSTSDRSVRIRFDEYLEAGGMPELYRSDRPVERLEETIDLVIYRDIIELFNAARSSVLAGLFRQFASSSGQVVNFNSLADALDADFRTVKKYIDYLEDSFLIARSYPHTGSDLASMRKNPKVYVADHAYNRIFGTSIGLRAETIAYNHLKRIEPPGFLKSPETDIVLPDSEVLVEVKYQDTISTSDLGALVENAEETGFRPLCVSKDTFETRSVDGHQVEIVPLHTVCRIV